MRTDKKSPRSPVRVVLAAALVLLVPLAAMQLTEGARWDLADFALAGTLLGGAGLLYELVARRTESLRYRAALGIALAAALLLVWGNLAVGFIGEPSDIANAMYLGVLTVGLIGAVAARLRPAGMAHAMFATALAQAAVAGIALIFRLGSGVNGPLEILAGNGVFVALFAGSGWLFHQSAQGH